MQEDEDKHELGQCLALDVIQHHLRKKTQIKHTDAGESIEEREEIEGCIYGGTSFSA